jgi:hypothetical protein
MCPWRCADPRISGVLTVRTERSEEIVADRTAVRTTPEAIICTDWSKNPANRHAWIPEPEELRLGPLHGSSSTYKTLVEAGLCALREAPCLSPARDCSCHLAIAGADERIGDPAQVRDRFV